MSANLYDDPEWLAAMYNSGLQQKELARLAGATKSTLRRRLIRYRILREPEPRLCDDRKWLARRRREGLTCRQIAALAGASVTTIARRLQQFKIVQFKCPKLYDDRKWLLHNYESGYSINDLARMSGTSNCTISRRLRRFGIQARTKSEALRLISDRLSETHTNRWTDEMRYEHSLKIRQGWANRRARLRAGQ